MLINHSDNKYLLFHYSVVHYSKESHMGFDLVSTFKIATVFFIFGLSIIFNQLVNSLFIHYE